MGAPLRRSWSWIEGNQPGIVIKMLLSTGCKWYKIKRKGRQNSFCVGTPSEKCCLPHMRQKGKDMNILVIDGQGGNLGKQLITQLRKVLPDQPITAIGTNSIATTVMLKAGAEIGASGENPVIVGCSRADFILGPIGILIADALLGEITPAMAAAVGKSRAIKILVPVSKCNCMVAGTPDLPLTKYIEAAVLKTAELIRTKGPTCL